MPRNRRSQPVLLIVAVLVLLAVVAFALSHNDQPVSKEAAAGKQAKAHTAKRLAEGTALALPHGVPQSKKALHSKDANALVGSKDSAQTPGGPAPRVPNSDSSDLERAVEAFHQSWQCHAASNEIKNLQGQIAVCESLGSAMDDICRRNIKQALTQIQIETARLAGCSTVPAVLEKTYFDSVVRAAELGNSDAQVCYIQGNFSVEISRQQIEQYKDNAPNYIQLGLKRGDWRVVSLAATDTNQHISGFLALVSLSDPYDIFRMNRLLRRGATGDYAQLLDSMGQDSAVSLSKAQLDAAFAWSRQEYEKYFINSPKLTARPAPCADPQTNP